MRRFILASMFVSAGIASATMASAPAQAAFNPLTQAYQDFNSTNCTFQGDCAVLFTAVPSKTIITHVSCEFFLASGGTALNAYLNEESTNPRFFLQPFSFAPTSSGTNYGTNAEVYRVYTKGQIPRVDVYSDGQPVQDLMCTVSGFHS